MSNSESNSKSNSKSNSESNSETRTSELIASIWKRNQPVVRERLAHLDAAADAADSGVVPEAQRAEAESIAHKLSGSLGMFGFSQATEIARSLELEWSAEEVCADRVRHLTRALREAVLPPAGMA